MPCNSDYLAPSGQELESRRVCSLIIYLEGCLKKKTLKWIQSAAEDYYGNINRLDEATKILCEICRSFTEHEAERYIYNSSKTSRKLADWWGRHQEWDARRVKEEKETRRDIILKVRRRALRKLTNGEIEALGLKDK